MVRVGCMTYFQSHKWYDELADGKLKDETIALKAMIEGSLGDVTSRATCASDIDGFCNGGELPGMVRVGCMTYFQSHKWYDELADGKLKDETIALKAMIEGSLGDVTSPFTRIENY
nr:hypothetical protein [Tanacetum cinerariifolium]